MFLKEGYDTHALTDRSDYSILSELVDGSPAIPAYSDSEIDASIYHSFSFEYSRSLSSIFGPGADFLEFKDSSKVIDDDLYEPVALLGHDLDSFLATTPVNHNASRGHAGAGTGVNASHIKHQPPVLCGPVTPLSPMFRVESSSRISAATPPVPTLMRSIDSISNFTSLPALSQQTTVSVKPDAISRKPDVEMKAQHPPKSTPAPMQMKKSVKNTSRSQNTKSQYKWVGSLEVLKRSIQLIYHALRELRTTSTIPSSVMDSLAQKADKHVYILSQDRKLFHWLETEHPKDIIQALLKVEGLDTEIKSRLAALVAGK